jgi:hypothetical protein
VPLLADLFFGVTFVSLSAVLHTVLSVLLVDGITVDLNEGSVAIWETLVEQVAYSAYGLK